MNHKTNLFLKQARLIGVKDLVGYIEDRSDKLNLTIGEPDFDTDNRIKQAAIDALNANVTHYAPPLGYEAVRQAIIDFEKEKHQLYYDLDEVCITQGSTEGISSVLFTLLNPEDEVIVPIPAYPLYQSVIEIAGAKLVPLKIEDDNWEINPEKLKALINEKTKALILTSPNNPTGTVFSKQSLEAIKEIIKESSVYVIVDEIYAQILYTDYVSFAQFTELKDRIIVIQSFSKIYAMTGWRLGFILAERELMNEIIKWHHNVMVSATSFIQLAIPAALKMDVSHIVESYRERRDYIYQRLIEMGFEVEKPEGAFYIFPSIKQFNMTSRQFCIDVANKAKVMFVPGDCFGSDDYVRISFCYSMESLKDGLDRLEQYIKERKEEII